MHPTISYANRTAARPLTRLAAALLVASACSGKLHAQQLLAPTAAVAGYSQSFTVVRNVTVRADQTLFLDLQVVTVWPDLNETEAELRAIGKNVIGNVNSMSVTVNGANALLPAGTASLISLRQTSALFPLQVIPDNLALGSRWWSRRRLDSPSRRLA
jgi:hypothetical protein